MTNRQKLGEELRAMKNKQIEKLIRSSWDLEERFNDMCCKDCLAAHEGSCPSGEDNDCVKTLEEWLGEECTRDRLLK